jgi:nucleoside-diphosphate-sugar epimerase
VKGVSVHVLILGAAGMIGLKLTARLVADGNVGGRAVERLTLADVVPPQHPAGAAGQVQLAATDLAAPGAAERLVEARPI